MLKRAVISTLQPLVANHVYTVRHGLARGLRRRGGLGFVPQVGSPSREEAFLEQLDFEGETVFDVGGYEGVFALFFARRIGSSGRLVTFEPNPQNYARIVENVKLNGFANVDVRPLALSERTLSGLRNNMLLFYTGDARSASAVLADQNTRSKSGDSEMLANLHRTKEIGIESHGLLLKGDLTGYALLMDEHWTNKRKRSPGMASGRIDRLYAVAKDSGAIGGKLVGAGGGGFLLVFSSEPRETRAAFKAEGAPELEFDFDFDGAFASVNK